MVTSSTGQYLSAKFPCEKLRSIYFLQGNILSRNKRETFKQINSLIEELAQLKLH